jgi:dipeptidyl aminopeptidase/acylaminoacyl peptidase
MAGAPGPAPNPRLRAWLEVPLAGAPHPAADSDTILYLSNEGGYRQPWAVPRGGGTPRRLYAGEERTEAVLPNPVRATALLSGDRGGNEHWQLELLPLEGTDRRPQPLTQDPAVIHAPGAWDSDGESFFFTSNARDVRYFDVYRIRPGTGEPPTRLREEDAFLAVRDARDGRVLAERLNTNLDSDLLLLSGGTWQHVNPHVAEESVLAAGLGKDAVFAAANPGREFCALLRYRRAGAPPEFLREYPGDVELVAVAPDGERVLLAVNRGGWSEAHLYDPRTAEDRPLLSGPKGVIGSFAWCPDGAGYVYELSHSDGQDVYYRAVETGKERRLTRARAPLPQPPAEPRAFTLRASDGVALTAWEYLPRSGPPRGTVVEAHGGPESQWRPRFSPIAQFLVGEGWRVLRPNVRGSTGFGRTFVHLDDVRKRMDSVRDLKEITEGYLSARRADPGRVAVAGGSYGGFMVLSALATYPDRFAAGVDIVGIANFLTFLEKTGPWRRPLREAEYGSLARDAEFLRSISPVFHAERIRAPLLVIHGRNDPRVPFEEAEQIVSTLRRLGRPVELMEYAREGHGLHRRDDQLEAWSRAAQFLADAIPGPVEAPTHGN